MTSALWNRAAVWLGLATCLLSPLLADERSRPVWSGSRFQGTPDPPLPYALQPAFPLEFSGPVSLNRLPDSEEYLVCEQAGKIYYFDASQPEPHKQLVVDFSQTPPPRVESGAKRRTELLSLVCAPDFPDSRQVFVCYVTHAAGETSHTHIARFDLTATSPPRLLPESEVDVLTCEGGGHNGCTLLFGNDEMLYISIGDLASPNPPDPRDTGQDISDLYASILRVDVRSASAEGNYVIPANNPFIELPTARPEVYAYGLRNPFRMSFDRQTGDLWVGDVGWEAWEMVYRIRAGGNYGWAIKEGPGDVKAQALGPTPISPADIALNHAEAASVTGGLVYRGRRFPDLTGTYIFGDWITRKFWAARFDAERVLDYREIAVGPVKPICFESDSSGELLILDYSEANQAAGIFRLVPNPALENPQGDFPRRLSQSGLFADVATQQPAAGVHTYRVNAAMWADGAEAEYLLALPNGQPAIFYQRPQTMFNWFKTQVELPVGSVLAKTYRLGPADHARPVETQISLKDPQGDWQYYSYRWNASGSDAELVAAEGERAEIEVPSAAGGPADGGAKREWQFASRTSCRICHTPWTGETIGLIEPQLRVQGSTDDSWHALLAAGAIVANADPPAADTQDYIGLVDPADADQPLDRRVRSYLHTNCGHCHLNGGNASTAMDVSFSKLLFDTGMLEQTPMRGELGLPHAKIVAPGRPAESVLLLRLAKAGAGRMPHVGSTQTDAVGVHLIKQWIAQLPEDLEQARWLDELCAPPLSRVDDKRRLAAASELLQSIPGSIEMAGALAEGRVPQHLVRSIVAEGLSKPSPIRDLIEPYAAADQQVVRLGTDFDPQQVLTLTGQAEAGRQLFAGGVGSCSGCHRVGAVGRELGPDLQRLSEKLHQPAALLQAIVRPSEEIRPEYQAVSILTGEGQVRVGRLLERTPSEIQLQEASGVVHTLAAADIEAQRPSLVSLMPEQLLAPLTAQQAADLLAYLQSLQKEFLQKESPQNDSSQKDSSQPTTDRQ